jgi:hypothetical protein
MGRVFVLLFLMGAVYVLIRLLSSRRVRGKILSLLRRIRLFVVRHPLLASFLLGFLALISAEPASKPGHHFSTLIFILALSSAIGLFVWAIGRRFGLRFPDALLSESPPVGRLKDFLCPSIGRLKDFLAERLPSEERTRLASHLETCTACQHRVEGLTAGQKSWPGMARKLSAHPPAPEPALRKLMERLKEDNVEETRDEPVFAGDLPLNFLSPSDKPDQLGRLERYEVLEEIGRGGMGVVLKAFDPTLHRVVAIKVLAPQLATSGVARKRFLREAKAAAAVTHDHIVTIHAVEEANGLPYLVMQYIAGQSLQQRIDKEGPLELAEVLRIGMQTASGLAAAHGQGIVHRDIKPANILLEDGVQRVKLTDFGLARAMDDASLTQSGFVAGSPLYMAPEQARGESLDHRADLFSLGSVLYTMCTGRPPFRAANTLAVLRRVSEDSPRPIRETNPEIPDWLVAVVEKLMAKNPADRYQSAGEVMEALGKHLAQLQHASWVPPPAPAPAPPSPNADLPTSLTICPSCGTSLYVPEEMVGGIVHCAECGKPFQAEDGSEVIQVARAVKPPFGTAPRPRSRIWRWVQIVAACAVLLFLLFLFMAAVYRLLGPSQPYATMAVRTTTTTKTTSSMPASQPLNVTPQERWAELNGLPAEASLFGAIRFPQPLNLDDAWTQALLRLVVPEEMAEQLTPENLGRIRFEALALGYYEGAKSKDARAIVHLTGTALDGRKRIATYVRRADGENVQVDPATFSVRLSNPELPFALKIVDDHHAYLAASRSRDAEDSQLRKILDGLPASHSIPAGDNPPWVQEAVVNIPSNACGFLIGEIPAPLRKLLTESLNLRVCPRTFSLAAGREGDGAWLTLTLNVDKAGADQTLRDDLLRARLEWFDLVRLQFPAVRKDSQPFAALRQTLNNLNWEADGGSVRTRVRISGSTLKALQDLLKQVG